MLSAKRGGQSGRADVNDRRRRLLYPKGAKERATCPGCSIYEVFWGVFDLSSDECV